MDIVAVNNNQFTHYPKRIPRGTVNAELVQLRLDKEWEGLTVFWHWRNMGTKAEIREELADHVAPHKIPWEVLTDLGDLEMGLVGMDGETTVKPTIWLTYGYVVEGVDPESGSDPQPPTPSWEQQMVEQATQANQAAQAAQKAAEAAAESVASAGPYAEEAKKSAEAAKASQNAAAISAQQASQAAKDAQAAAGSIGNAVEQAQSAATAADVAQRAAETAQTAAAQSADAAQTHAGTASQSAQDAQSAATQAGQYLASVEADAQAAASAATAAGKSQEAAQGAANNADSSAKNAEEYAKQALASVLPNSIGIPDDYVLKTMGGLPVWGKIDSGGKKLKLLKISELPAEAGKLEESETTDGVPFSELALTEVKILFTTSLTQSTSYNYGTLSVNGKSVFVGQNFSLTTSKKFFFCRTQITEDGSALVRFIDHSNVPYGNHSVSEWATLTGSPQNMTIDQEFGTTIDRVAISTATKDANLTKGTKMIIFGR